MNKDELQHSEIDYHFDDSFVPLNVMEEENSTTGNVFIN